MRGGTDRRNIDNEKPRRIRKSLSHLFRRPLQTILLISPRTVGFALQAGVEQLEIEYHDFAWIGEGPTQNISCDRDRKCEFPHLGAR